MSDILRKKLETNVERQMHGLVSEIREHVVDFTVLKVRRSYPEIDRDQLTKILEIVKAGVDDGFMTKVDRFVKKLDESLVDFAESNQGGSNAPLVGTEVPTSPKAKKPSGRATSKRAQ